MKNKVFHIYGTAVDKDGEEHVVTMVGELTKTKEKALEESENHGDSITLKCKTRWTRTLKYGFSICHTSDLNDFNEELGVQIGLRRARTSPLGELTTTRVTTLCDEQVKMILLGELQYVVKNIDKYIKKR